MIYTILSDKTRAITPQRCAGANSRSHTSVKKQGSTRRGTSGEAWPFSIGMSIQDLTSSTMVSAVTESSPPPALLPDAGGVALPHHRTEAVHIEEIQLAPAASSVADPCPKLLRGANRFAGGSRLVLSCRWGGSVDHARLCVRGDPNEPAGTHPGDIIVTSEASCTLGGNVPSINISPSPSSSFPST